MTTLVFHPDVFVFSDSERHLLYHAVTHTHLEVPRNDFWDRVLSAINSATSLYRHVVTDEEIHSHHPTLSTVCQLGFASLYKENDDIPFSYAPIPKFDFDLETIRYKNSIGEGREILSFLKTMVYYLSPIGKVQEEHLIAHLAKLNYCPIGRIEVYVLHPKSASRYSTFISSLVNNFSNVHLLFPASVWSEKELLKINKLYRSADCHVYGPLTQTLPLAKTYSVQIEITSEEDMQQALDKGMNSVSIKCTADNLPFIKQVLFTQEEDLYHSSKRDIFIRETLNSNYFGHLLSDANGQIRAGIYGEVIGAIEDPLYDVIYQALTKDDSLWMLHRGKTACRSCRFKYLCPCISDYEFVLGDVRLCWKNNAYYEEKEILA